MITGARFVKFNRTIFLQIQEGKLLPYGEVDAGTIRWVKLNKNPRGKKEMRVFFRIKSFKIIVMIRFFFYSETYELEWKNGREIELNDIIAEKGYVLTKLLFYVDLGENGQKRLRLGAYTQNLDFHSGKLRKSSVFAIHVQLDDYSEK